MNVFTEVVLNDSVSSDNMVFGMDSHRQFPCASCGADLKFDPGVETLRCPYCGHENEIELEGDVVIVEKDFHSFLEAARAEHVTQEVLTVKCPGCAAETTLDPNITSDECPFCGTSLVKTAVSQKQIKPEGILPFSITNNDALQKFRAWLGSLWFAPNKLQEFARRQDGLSGMYIPHWTYDAETTTRYTGQRGEYYYTTETYSTVENGRSVTRTRTVRKTRWYPAFGTVQNSFDDVLVSATESLPRSYVQGLQPWDLPELVPYKDEYVSGFRSESYHIDLEQGFDLARDIMAGVIDSTIRSDIGGDEQRIFTRDTDYRDITFKHILLPIWISAYRYRDKVYRFMVNGRTGTVQGERPWSWIKISLAVLAAIIVIGTIIFFTQQSN